MKERQARLPNAARLRRRAEARLSARKPAPGSIARDPQSAPDSQRLIHELQVHQVELEMQNEELQSARDEIAAGLEHCTELYDFAPVGYLTLTRDGTIRRANLTAASMLGTERSRLLSRRFAVFVAAQDRAALATFLSRAFEGKTLEAGEVRLAATDQPPLTTRLQACVSGNGQECRVVLTDITELRRDEEALRASERFTTDILNALTAHIAVLSPQGVIIAVNEAWRRFARDNGCLHPDAYLGENYFAVCETRLRRDTDESVATALRGLHAVISGRQDTFSLEYPCHSPRQERWFNVRVTRFGAKSAIRVVVAHEDITARVRAESILRDAELRFRTVADFTFDWELWIGAEGRLEYCSPSCQRITGYSAQEFMSDPGLLLRLIHPDDLSSVGRHWVLESAGGPPGELEFRLVTRGGGVRWINHVCQPVFGEGGGCLGRRASNRDITERKRAELELRESEQKFAAAFRASPNLMAITRIADGTILEVNAGFSQVLGYSRGEAVGRTTVELRIWADPTDRVTFVNHLKESGRITDFETRLRRKDGTLVTVLDSARTVTLKRETCVLSVVHDITERKQAEQRMRMFSQELLSAREQERRRVSAVLHHDVGSLAVGVSAHLEAVEADLRSGKSGDALRWVKRTRELFGESVTRLKELAVQLRPPELDILGLSAALRQHFSRVTKHAGVCIRFRESLGPRCVSGDTATILFRIAQEALTNAISHGRATRVCVSLRASKANITLTIRDNGAGFNPSRTTTRRTSQMGLRVMRETTLFAGGHFAIDSARGRGTRVCVSLPLKAAAPGGADDASRKPTAASAKTARSTGRASRPKMRNRR